MGGFSHHSRDSAVEKITVEKARLVARLQENLETHKKSFKEAYAGYLDARATAIVRIAEVASATDHLKKKDRKKLTEVWNTYSNLDVPQDHSKDYDQALALMDWDTKEDMDLSIQDFEYFINDNWEWTGKFQRTMSSYSNR